MRIECKENKLFRVLPTHLLSAHNNLMHSLQQYYCRCLSLVRLICCLIILNQTPEACMCTYVNTVMIKWLQESIVTKNSSDNIFCERMKEPFGIGAYFNITLKLYKELHRSCFTEGPVLQLLKQN